MCLVEIPQQILGIVNNGAFELIRPEALGLTFLTALAFAMIHMYSGRIHKFLHKQEHKATSFSGGMAIAYVFMHLIDELGKGDKLLGKTNFSLLCLMGFLVFYGLENYACKSLHDEKSHDNLLFCVELAFAGVYNFLIIYAIPEQFQKHGPFAFLYILAMGLHLLCHDRSFSQGYSREFHCWGRYVLVAAVACGFFIDVFSPQPSKLISDALIAILAGSLLFNIFKEEVPEPEHSSFLWFSSGVLLYTGLLFFLN